MLTRLAKHPHRCRARSHQIAHRFVGRIGNPYCCQFAGPMQFGQHHRVAAVRLDTIASLHRDQRRRHHDAVMSETRKLPVKTIAARSGLVAETQPPPALGKPFRHLGDLLGAVWKCSHVADLAATQPLCNGNNNRRLMHIQTHEYGSVHQAIPHA